MFKTISIALLGALISICACKKTKNNTTNQTVTIAITSPEEGHNYHAGDSVHIEANVSYNGVLHGYEVKVSDTTSGEITYDYAEDIHKDSFHISRSFVASGTQVHVYKLVLTAEIDHNGDDVAKQVIYKFQP